MKNIIDFLTEASVHFKWGCKYISQNDFIKIAKEVMKKFHIQPNDIQNEISQYKDPDDLWDAYDHGKLTNYSKFEENMLNALANNNKYADNKENIMNYFFDEAYDILDLI